MKFLVSALQNTVKPVITMGNFDGFHIGHQRLLELVKRRAVEIGGESIVLTYYHHPFEILHKKPYPYLLTEKDKKEKLIKSIGVDKVLYLKFDDVIANMAADTFLKDILIAMLHPMEIFVGYDTHFGRNRCGDYRFLKQNEDRYGYKTFHIPPVKCSGQIVSSTLIRKLISEGFVEQAKQLLGRNYSIEGRVVHGEGIGRTLGYPTINLQPLDQHKLIPRCGIYLTKVLDEQLREFYGLTNIGFSPTLKKNSSIEIETFILDFEEDVYGGKFELFFLERIRDEITYGSKEDLQRAIALDVDYAYGKIALINKGQDA